MGDKTRAHVLVVDDDTTLRSLLRLMLRQEGYAVAVAPDGQRALEILRTSRYHMVVLLDLLMPKMGGDMVLEVVEAEDKALSEHAYMLVTANMGGIGPAFHALLQRLEVPVIPKPFEALKLLAAVRDAVGRLPEAS